METVRKGQKNQYEMYRFFFRIGQTRNFFLIAYYFIINDT